MKLPPPPDDGLETPEVNEWARDKHHFLLRYIDAFTTAMRKKRWAGLHYIDLFAGAGIARLKKSRDLDWGSPLIAAQAKYPFDKLHLCESRSASCSALEKRLCRIRPRESFQLLLGDANERVHEIVAEIPNNTLSLAFLDPYGLHLDYDTIGTLAQKRADLIIYFPDRVDILRNWNAYYWDHPASNLDGVLGPGSNWRSRIEAASTGQQKVKALLEIYKQQIQKLGYTEFEWEAIPSTGQRLYWLIYCSRVPIGARIWRGISQIKPDQQRTFDFD